MMSWLCESPEGKMALASAELAPLLIQASDILERLAYQREDSILCSWHACYAAQRDDVRQHLILSTRGVMSCRKPQGIRSPCHHLLCSLSAGATRPTLLG